MRAWSAPDVPSLPVRGPQVSLHDSASGRLVPTDPQGAARLYVCGITPYDATHMGHAATYVAFDLLVRAWRNAGHDVTYVQNVTDVDDPLLERAAKVGTDWVTIAERETQLFRDDMESLRVLPPAHYVGAVESIPWVVEMIERLAEAGAIYHVDDDLYFSVGADPTFGSVSGADRETMRAIFAERGGDPDRPGKRDPLDCLVWMAERPGEPSWESPFGRGRPGWHIECTAIALKHLGSTFDVQGGGSDLVFPHHEMCAAEAQAAVPDHRFAKAYVHAGMVAYDGEKMSKSKGNLVFVSQLRFSEVDSMAIRLVLLGQHYRSDWEWTDELLWAAGERLDVLRKAVSLGAGAPSGPVVEQVLAALADDLDAPTALASLQAWAEATLGSTGLADTSDPDAGRVVRELADAALGLQL
ncbi:cysteine--1-D-myo-inosityl 2-amino-2-deoxy-alpha-D-glucopyranoside ligase [Nocardioides zeae]|uniref:L-cysteine:1D-myo-inositol 2-amino-2-deoxy-alpha-D-glucopyranoside ligase n=1 Tax=Nocardioides zeae TaxID=1457234 RepID=A0A6P0HJQ4_9ACTN|nr:cysteine--1-D-myo-inosityl 2-amino-2-deoxy-alpha-D-glucopyranoside ligase [Nocardioides zeae]NEN78467.1 cysteine--1-D-myo-inosityl 2-amino-2-deoxy-alpha-D-glucopyranoside ligase [Nocardioides zeae]